MHNDTAVLWIAFAVAGFLVYEEFLAPKPVAAAQVNATPNALGVPTAAPSVLAPSQTGAGLFGNPSGLGANPPPPQSGANFIQHATANLISPPIGGGGPLADVPVQLE